MTKFIKNFSTLLLIFPILVGCSSKDDLYSDISDLRGFFINVNSEKLIEDYSNYQNNENIYALINNDYSITNSHLDFVNYNGLSSLPNLQYNHYYNVEGNKYNVLTSNYIEIKVEILTSSIERIVNNLYFVSEDDNKYEIDDDYEYSRNTFDNKVNINLKDVEFKSIRGEKCLYGIGIIIDIVKQDTLKQLEIYEYKDEISLRTTLIKSYKENFVLTSETEYYFIRSTYIDDNGNEYTFDSPFYSEEKNNYEVHFMNEFGYVDKNERYMNIKR